MDHPGDFPSGVCEGFEEEKTNFLCCQRMIMIHGLVSRTRLETDKGRDMTAACYGTRFVIGEICCGQVLESGADGNTFER